MVYEATNCVALCYFMPVFSSLVRKICVTISGLEVVILVVRTKERNSLSEKPQESCIIFEQQSSCLP